MVYSNAAYDYGQLINSAVGKKLAAAMAPEYDYDDAEDPALIAHWENMGLKCEFHDKNGEQWITFIPKQALEHPEQKIPCVCIFQEVNRFDPHQADTGFAYFSEYQEITAQGECMLLYFVLETLLCVFKGTVNNSDNVFYLLRWLIQCGSKCPFLSHKRTKSLVEYTNSAFIASKRSP